LGDWNGEKSLFDKKVPHKLKGKFYPTSVRPMVLYGTQCLAVNSQHKNQVSVDRIKYDTIREIKREWGNTYNRKVDRK